MADSLIAEIKELYDFADRFAREVGEARFEVQIPAINELRYAGHHVLNSLGEDGTVDEGELRKSKSHCERAMYEAAEAGIMFYLESINAFKEEFKDLVVSEVIPDYHKHLARAQKAVDVIVAGRSGRASVEEQVETYMAEFRAVRDIMDVFDAAREDLNAKREQLEEAKRRHDAKILMAVLGIVVTVFLALFFT